MSRPAKGSLTIVGTGFLVVQQTTPEAETHLRNADRLLYAVGDSVTETWLEGLNPNSESLSDAYGEGKPRRQTYREMVERILAPVRRGERVCVAFYGHPGVCVIPSHDAIRQARQEGHEARMLPGISAEDCLFADLGVNPLDHGCLSFEATGFLIRRRPVDPCCALVLWQVGAIAVDDYRQVEPWNRKGLAVLAEVLRTHYPRDHRCAVYEAPSVPMCKPHIEWLTLDDLPEASVSTASTLYVPPASQAPVDQAMMERLGMRR